MYVTVEVRDTVIVPSTHVLQQGEHTLLRRESVEFRVELQYLRFAHQSLGRNAEMGWEKASDFVTT